MIETIYCYRKRQMIALFINYVLNFCGRMPLVDRFETNWNYFGGSAPADEVVIFKGQSRLLLSQLLFERYQTEMYAQRNRQLVRKTYRLNALEEECLAMVN